VRLRRAQWFIVLAMGGVIIVALCFMLLLPLRISSGGSKYDCGAPLSVLTDSGSAHASRAREQKCEHHATLRLRNFGIVLAVTAVGGLAMVLVWPEDEDEETGIRRVRRPPLTRRFP